MFHPNVWDSWKGESRAWSEIRITAGIYFFMQISALRVRCLPKSFSERRMDQRNNTSWQDSREQFNDKSIQFHSRDSDDRNSKLIIIGNERNNVITPLLWEYRSRNWGMSQSSILYNSSFYSSIHRIILRETRKSSRG